MDSKVKKDNLTDLISDLTKPVEAKPNSSDSQKPIVEPPKDMTDYQVVTPEGEVITLNKVQTPTVQKFELGSNIEKLLVSKDKKGRRYIVIVVKPTS